MYLIVSFPPFFYDMLYVVDFDLSENGANIWFENGFFLGVGDVFGSL